MAQTEVGERKEEAINILRATKDREPTESEIRGLEIELEEMSKCYCGHPYCADCRNQI